MTFMNRLRPAVKTRLNQSRIAVITFLGFAAACGIGIPLIVFARQISTSGYVLAEQTQAKAEYNSYVPAAPQLEEYPDSKYAAALLETNYAMDTMPGTAGIYALWHYSKISGPGPNAVRLRVVIEVVKATPVPTIVRDPNVRSVVSGTTTLPVETGLQDPHAGYARPWSSPVFELSSGGAVTAAILPQLPLGTSFTATYTAKVDTARYVEGDPMKLIVTYRIVSS